MTPERLYSPTDVDPPRTRTLQMNSTGPRRIATALNQVNCGHRASGFTASGRDVERTVLCRATCWRIENSAPVYGNKTLVFP